MKILFLLYFLMGSPMPDAIEAFEADAFDDSAITAFNSSVHTYSL
jgi:hypothetical protein